LENVFNGVPLLEHIMNAIDAQLIFYPNPDEAPPQWDASPKLQPPLTNGSLSGRERGAIAGSG